MNPTPYPSPQAGRGRNLHTFCKQGGEETFTLFASRDLARSEVKTNYKQHKGSKERGNGEYFIVDYLPQTIHY